jgi:hypothetical protein
MRFIVSILIYAGRVVCLVAVSAALVGVMTYITLSMLLDNNERAILFTLIKGE